jgi:hypothetical protein
MCSFFYFILSPNEKELLAESGKMRAFCTVDIIRAHSVWTPWARNPQRRSGREPWKGKWEKCAAAGSSFSFVWLLVLAIEGAPPHSIAATKEKASASPKSTARARNALSKRD